MHHRRFFEMLAVLLLSSPAFAVTPAGRASGRASLRHLAEVMDQYHTRFPVYDDVSSAGNHFFALTKIPDENAAIEINGSWPIGPHSGATAFRAAFTNTNGVNFGGFYFQNGLLLPGTLAPVPNFGTEPDAGIDLTGAVALTFWARGEQGGEQIEFLMGGVGRNADTGVPLDPCTPTVPGPCLHPDSTPVVKALFTLSTQWQRFVLDLQGRDLTYVLGGFGWVANAPNNPNGAVFYIDDIQYELSPAAREHRLSQPRLLRSFATLPRQPDPFDANLDDDIDFVLRNLAFTYDNALAVLAFLADDQPDSLRRARLIGDALVYATGHDRTFDDGRLRTAYAAGDLSLPPGWTPNGRKGTVPSPGFFDERQQRFFEVEQGAVDTGNNAWAMIALLSLHHRTGEPSYLTAVQRLGDFVRTFRNDPGPFPGFLGGIQDPEGVPAPRTYASSEHNIDLHAAFTGLFRLTGDSRWKEDADLARSFVESMWSPDLGCYLTGTTPDGDPNATPGQLPVDVQVWSILAFSDTLALHPTLFDCVARNHALRHHGFIGVDFNEHDLARPENDGVWFEGTAQTAEALAWAGEVRAAETVRRQLRRAQGTAPFGDGRGLTASCHDALETGFGFKYFQRLHVGATAWNVFAQLEFNPFAAAAGTP